MQRLSYSSRIENAAADSGFDGVLEPDGDGLVLNGAVLTRARLRSAYGAAVFLPALSQRGSGAA